MQTINTLLEKYPSLQSEVFIKQFADDEYMIYLQKGRTEKITRDAFDVYSLCDGQSKTSEIIEKLQVTYDLESADLDDFINYATNRNIITLNELPCEKGFQNQTDYNSYYPLNVLLLLTTKCNLRCNYCYGNYSSKNEEVIPLSKVKDLFEFLSSINIRTIEISGGEPLTHPDFYEIFSLALQRFSFVSVLSNGVLFNDKIISLLSKYKEKVCVQISIDGSSEFMNDKVRGKKHTWPVTLENIEKIARIGIPFRIGYVITNENFTEIEDAAGLMRKLGVKNIIFSLAEGIGRGKNIGYPDKMPIAYTDSPHFSQISKKLEEVTIKNEDIVFNKKWIECFEHNIDKERNCGAGYKKVIILPSGDLIPCPLMNPASTVVTNIFKKDQLDNYCNPTNEKYMFFKSFSKKPFDEKCQDCDYKNYCGSCLMRIFHANSQMKLVSNDLCPYLKSLDKDSLINSLL